MRRPGVCLVVTVLALAVWCTPASAATWSADVASAFSGSLTANEDGQLELPWTIVWQVATNEPRSVERLPDGNTLVARGYMGVVEEFTPAGTIAWSYRGDATFYPWHATRLASGNTLIVGRRSDDVIEVTPDGTIVWRYGGLSVPREPGAELVPGYPGYLQDPFSASRLPNGNTLICDNQSGLVLEIRSVDYRPGEINDGYTSDSVVWSCSPGGSSWPKTAQRLANGNTLIAASETLVEVDASGTTVWQLGPPVLREPVSGYRLEDGTTLIAEERSSDTTLGRVVRVNSAGEVLWEFSAVSLLGLDDDGLSTPRRAIPGTDGSILIADEDNNRLVELGYAQSGEAQTAQLDCGLPGARKSFTSISMDLDVPAGTTATAEYSIDGGAWQSAAGALPANTYGTLIAVRVRMSSTRRDLTPRLLGIAIGYEAAPESPTGGGAGTGTGTGTGTGSRPRRSTGTGTQSGTAATGVMAGGDGYTTGGTISDAPAGFGALSQQRGWAMATVGASPYPGTSGTGTGGGSAPSADGLLALGAMYGAGVLSVPLQRLLLLLLHRPNNAL